MVKSSLVLWVVSPLVLTLSLIRPANPRSDRASSVPQALGGFVMTSKEKITPAHERLLGTKDVAWRVYEDAAGNRYYLTMVFHDQNWKSLHPPHLCIRGSNFDIQSDGESTAPLADGREISVGRIVASKRNSSHQQYVSLFAFVGTDFVTPRYSSFYLHHFLPAVLRRSTPGFLLRVEAFVGPDGRLATERRCWTMFREFLVAGEARITAPE